MNITYRDRFTGHKRSAQVKRLTVDGRIVVMVGHRAARGGSWIVQPTIIRASQVVR